MKRILTGLLITVATLIPTSAAFADSVIQTSFGGYYYPTPTAFDITGTNGNYVMFMRDSGFHQAAYSGNNGVIPFHKASTYNLVGNLNLSVGDHVVAFAFAGPLSGPCTGNDPAACRANSQYRGEATFIYGVAPPILGCTDSAALNFDPAATQNDGSCNYRPNLPQIISQSDNHFASSTGFTTAAGVGFVGNTFIMPWIGTGIAAFWSLRYWIAALLAIAAIAYFAFRGFRFLNTR